ncbi:glucose 1-dehydrogenase [Polycyclovorans algicola]|uniref:glucose 1-dehydrogenase n=1 Tax=Polycyclovorans algicola TaxID=616992 RepID=UPI0004A70316|nr:glucose 1-dehydrogenase [Polycyclovorans algicola]
MASNGRVAGKVALITGGGKGLGEATAHLLAREGAKIAVSDLDTKAGKAVAAAINKAGGEAIFIQQDVTDETRWPKVIAQVKKKLGGLHVLVNSAGIAIFGSAEDTPLDDWRNVLSVNLDAVYLGTQHGIKAMKDGVGSIINISSAMGLVADANLAAYNASKGGVRLFSKSAALHCGQSGYKVRVNSVHPGYIWTPMVSGALATIGDVDEGRKTLDAKHPIGYVGEPNDVAYGILYLASDESKFVTGSELVIDGGYTAQ